jgi:glycerol-3-phosphate O-acyltransferase
MYRVPERKRIELDVSKNMLVHFFAERALVSIALLMPPGPDLEVKVARDRVAKLAELFKHEFRYKHDRDYDALWRETLSAMQSRGEAELFPGGRVDVGSGHDGYSGAAWLRLYAAIVRNFVEGYRIAARGLTALLRGPLTEKELLKRTLTIGHRMYLAGEIGRHEAISKPILQNALLAFKDEGYVLQREGKYRLTPSFETADAVQTIEARIAAYLESALD